MHFEIPYDKQILVFRIAVLVLPVLVFALTLRICRDLRDSDVHPLRVSGAPAVRGRASGGYEEL